MTAICAGGGASQAKPGFAATVAIAPWGIGALLNNVPTPWAVGLGLLLGTIVYELGTFCTVDPPVLPTLTAQDAIDLLDGPVGANYLAAVTKFKNFIGYYAWFNFCECSAGAQPSAGAPQAQPTDWPQFNPGIAGPNLGANPCATIKTGTFTTSSTAYVQESGGLQAPANATGVLLTAHAVSGSVVPDSQYRVSRNTTANNYAGASNFGLAANPANGATVQVGLVGATPGAWYFADARQINGVPMVGDITIDIYCANQTPFNVTGCQDCPPGPALQAAIDQLLGMVTLIQRQAAPFAYVYGANHTGLSGDGNFAVADLLGVSLDITTLPASYGQKAGDPTELFGLGFITLGTVDGVTQSRRVDADGVLFLPPAAGVFTSVHYSLAPGVVVAIRELAREP